MRLRYSFVYGLWILMTAGIVQVQPALGQRNPNLDTRENLRFIDPSFVQINGILGTAISSSWKGRLTELPTWDDGILINMFSKDSRAVHDKTDWYGEHAGKWLYAAAIAARQTHDEVLTNQLLNTANYLVATQEEDGYLGTYSPAVRLTSETANHNRSWDVWTLSYMALGMLKVNEYFPDPGYLNAAKRIGELFIKVFGADHDITQYGTRHGVSASIALDPVVELYKATGDPKYLIFAKSIIKRMEENQGNKLVSRSLNGSDMETVGDGKAYQILWNLTALVKLYEVTGNQDYLKAVKNAWQNIHDYHLTIAGGPWGGIGKHKECFNSKNYWSPYGYVETCSTMSWIQLNKELLRLTGDAKYAQEIEKSAYNALLGAKYSNGVDWCYHSFSNGSRHIAHFNDCCPSSGAMGLEELISLMYARKESGIVLNLFTDSRMQTQIEGGGHIRITQQTGYPFEGTVRVTLVPDKPMSFPLFIRIPDWAQSTRVSINGKPVEQKAIPGEYLKLLKNWHKNDVVEVRFPMELAVHHKSEQAEAPQGGIDLYDIDWFALTRGPLVYAADGLIEEKDRERVVDLPGENERKVFSEMTASAELHCPAYGMSNPDIKFLPYYLAGGRASGTWHLTWIQNRIDK
jgi:uncharacterized protein